MARLEVERLLDDDPREQEHLAAREEDRDPVRVRVGGEAERVHLLLVDTKEPPAVPPLVVLGRVRASGLAEVDLALDHCRVQCVILKKIFDVLRMRDYESYKSESRYVFSASEICV